MLSAFALDAVVANPRSDEPRERVADLLALAEPETSQFIRAQLDLARRRRAAGVLNPEIERAAWACGRPHPAHEQRAMLPVARLLADSGVPHWAPEPRWGRGFVEGCDVDGAWFARHGQELTAIAPVIDLVVHRLPANATDFFDSPALAHLRSLRFEGPKLTVAQVECLAQSAYLARLAVLDLARMDLPQVALDALLYSAGLGALRYVRAVGNRFPDINPQVDADNDQMYGEFSSSFAAKLRELHGEHRWLDGFSEARVPVPEALG